MAAPIARRNPHKLQDIQEYTDCRCLDQSKGLGLGLPGAKRWPSGFTRCGSSFLKQMNGRRRNTRKEAGVCCVTDDGSLLLARVPPPACPSATPATRSAHSSQSYSGPRRSTHSVLSFRTSQLFLISIARGQRIQTLRKIRMRI